MPQLTGPILYIAIFLGKLIEVTLATFRISFVSKGRKLGAVVVGFVEIVFWIVIVSSVITDVREDPLKGVAYCLSFTCGIVVGMYFEQKMALGMTSVQIVTSLDDGEMIGRALRENSFGVTILEGHSVDGTKRELLFVQLKRKRVPELFKLVEELAPHAILTASDARQTHGGFIK